MGGELLGEGGFLSAEDPDGGQRWLLGGESMLVGDESELPEGSENSLAGDEFSLTTGEIRGGEGLHQAASHPCSVPDFNPPQPRGVAWGPTCFVHQHFCKGGRGWVYRSWADQRECSTSFPYCTTGRSASPTSLAFFGLQKDDPTLQATEEEGSGRGKRRKLASSQEKQEGEKEK